MLARSALTGALALAMTTCSPGPSTGPTSCTFPFVGDAKKPPTIEIIGLDPAGNTVPLTDGGMVTLAFPPQGGRVIFAGVRATNVDPCAVQLGGVVRDETTMQVRLDSRTVNLVPSGDGWAASTDIASFSNIPVCPNEWTTKNLYGSAFELEVDVTDREGRTASQSLQVVPACSEPAHAAECLCICKGGYVLGQSCADGGT